LLIIIILLLFFYSINYFKSINKINEEFNNIVQPFELSLFIEDNNSLSNEKLLKLSDNIDNVLNKKKFSYYRCKDKMLGTVLKNIFDTNNIINENKNWDIYIPCGYNNVEEELKKIVIQNNNQDIKTKYIFGLNGCDSIVSKNKIWESLVKCYGRKYASTLMPESYILDDLNEMQVFRSNFKSHKNEIYILKKNVQRKEGLKLTRDFFEILSGSADNYRVVQKYMTDLYLVKNRKINLRIYLLIVIKDFTIYFYSCKNGKCIYTNKEYNDNDLDFESNITSYHLDMSIYKKNPRNFKELSYYIDINSENKNNSKILFDNIELLMHDISICLAKNFYQSKNISGTTCFQLFGADVIFNKEFHPYLLELNKGPDMSARDKIDENMKRSVQNDMFKIVGILENDDNNSFYLIHKNYIDRK
jgi:hypothetical protein